jgi:DNA-binding transcriptional MerR regulator
MQVKQLAKMLGVSPDTVRYYTRIGLLNPKKAIENGYKIYSPNEQNRLRFILSARDLGFSVDVIKQIFHKADEGESPCPTVRRLIDNRLHETEQRFQDTLRLRARMHAAVDNWGDKPDKKPSGNVICHLIDEFTKTPE